MIYPIVAYGDPVLRKRALAIEEGTDVKELARDILATIDAAPAAGLAAPQIGKSLRLFAVELSYLFKKQYRKILINPELRIEEDSILQYHEEYCMSIPEVGVDVARRDKITIRYFDENWEQHEEALSGLPARVMQHEYDHLEGKLHIDYASPLRKGLIKHKLAKISKGKINVTYKIRFPT